MKVDKDLMKMMRSGKFQSEILRRNNDSGDIVGTCILLSFAIIVFVVIGMTMGISQSI